MLIKHAVVARKHPQQKSQRHVFFQYGPDTDERREGAFLTRVNWDEMGQPEEITITIEVGDQLKEEENHYQNQLDKIPSRAPNVNLNYGQ